MKNRQAQYQKLISPIIYMVDQLSWFWSCFGAFKFGALNSLLSSAKKKKK